jgi:signal transduction histidine kinase
VWAFSIQPMFYQTAWFLPMVVTGALLFVWGAWQLRLRQVRREFALLLRERARLSREIHDTLLQSLVGVALQFDAIAADVDASSARTKEQFVRMRKRVEENIREARQSIWNLRSPTLERRDLASALREFGQQAAAAAGVSFSLEVTGAPQQRLPKVEAEVLRIAQEAVTNALRHARASHVKVEMQYGEGALTLRVSDDGCGFDPVRIDAQLDGHYGLVSMRERAAEVGGQLEVTSDRQHGTRITVVVPAVRRFAESGHANS